MASSKEYLAFVLEQLKELPGVTYRAMMGEYILYVNGKIFGGIYDDRFLVKPVPSAFKVIQNPVYVLPYEGAKQMLMIEDIENRELLAALLEAIVDDLPAPKTKKRQP